MASRDDTRIGGTAAAFPSTQWSILRDARDRGSPGYRDAIGDLCLRYWKPAYLYLRSSRPMDNERAKDLTQQFLFELVQGDLLSRYSPDHGSFRAYLRGALRLFLLEEHRDAAALKRGERRLPPGHRARRLRRRQRRRTRLARTLVRRRIPDHGRDLGLLRLPSPALVGEGS